MPQTSSNAAQHDIPVIKGLSTIAGDYNAAILDIWGVIHNGEKLEPHAFETMKALKAANIQTCLLSNTPMSGDQIVTQLEGMGLPRDMYTDIITAGDSAHDHVAENLDKKYMIIGGYDDEYSFLTGLSLENTRNIYDADILINMMGGTREPDFDEKTKTLYETAIQKGIPMICGNPDHFAPSGDNRIHVCPGYYADIYEKMGGHVDWHGKPHLPFYERVWKKLGHQDKSKIFAVGDSMRTDLPGAENFGVDGILNLAGLNRHANIDDIRKKCHDQNIAPIGILQGFHW